MITLLWSDEVRWIPIHTRVFDKDRDGKTKNDHFAEMLLAAFERGFNPEIVCFDSWYASIENLKLCRSLDWHFLTRLKENRKIRIDGGALQAVSQAGLGGGNRTIVWLKDYGEIKVFCVRATDGTAEYGATSVQEMSEAERQTQAAWRIEMYHRAIKQQGLIEREQCRRFRPVLNHIGLCLRAFLRIENHCYQTKISWLEAKTSIFEMPFKLIWQIQSICFFKLRKFYRVFLYGKFKQFHKCCIVICLDLKNGKRHYHSH